MGDSVATGFNNCYLSSCFYISSAFNAQGLCTWIRPKFIIPRIVKIQDVITVIACPSISVTAFACCTFLLNQTLWHERINLFDNCVRGDIQQPCYCIVAWPAHAAPTCTRNKIAVNLKFITVKFQIENVIRQNKEITVLHFN